jgi:hypothetical protein
MEENLEKALSDVELRHIKSQYNKAKDILEKVHALSLKYDATATLLKGREDEIERVSTDARERLNTIENAKNESATHLVEIKNSVEKVQTDIVALDESLLRFENIKGKIESKDGEIENLVITANGLRQDIENAKVTALERLTDIDNLLAQFQEKLAKMQEVYEGFLGLSEKISDENSGLQAILNQAIELQKKSKEVFQEITTFRDDASAQLLQIKSIREESDSLKNEISENLAKTEADRDEVASITALITDTGFANAFQAREKKLFRGSMFWLVVFLLSVGGLALMLYEFFGGLNTVPDPAVVLYRLTLTSPLLIVIGFAITQYRNDRNLTEKYAFKAVIAAVIRNHTKFLTDLSKESTPETILFAKDTIENVYKEPYLKEEKPKKQKKQNLREMVDNITELKALVPDDASLRSILELFIKIR